jgi:hypothetical protein
MWIMGFLTSPKLPLSIPAPSEIRSEIRSEVGRAAIRPLFDFSGRTTGSLA